MTGELLVSEIFGPTFQGEGPSAGQRAAFLRLSQCNLACTWCDTPYTWDASRFDLAAESTRMNEAQALHELLAVDAPLVVITGGEPLLQQDQLIWLADMCRGHRRRVEIETNGTVPPRRGLIQSNIAFNVSIKLAHSGVAKARRIKPAAVEAFVRASTARWKFVVRDGRDLDEVADLERTFGIEPIWVMPEGTDADIVTVRARGIADAVLARGWNLSTRLHTLLWGDIRGR